MNTEPKRIQLSRKKGWRMSENTVKVDRTTEWGNRWRVGDRSIVEDKVLDAADVVRKHREFLESRPDLQDIIRHELRGKNLACWCPIGSPCHGDTLLEIANR